MAYIFMLLSLALTCYNEAGGQGRQAMEFVADTVINRVNSPKFPNTVNEVIYQRGAFEWTKHYKHKSIKDLKRTQAKMMKQKDPHGNHNFIWLDAVDISAQALATGYKPKTHNLFFSSHTIKQHSVKYTYRHHSKHKH